MVVEKAIAARTVMSLLPDDIELGCGHTVGTLVAAYACEKQINKSVIKHLRDMGVPRRCDIFFRRATRAPTMHDDAISQKAHDGNKRRFIQPQLHMTTLAQIPEDDVIVQLKSMNSKLRLKVQVHAFELSRSRFSFATVV